MNESNLQTMRHSCSHILAAAVQQLYPQTKFTIGPATDKGFYYDFEFIQPVSEDDLSTISQKMTEIIAADLSFQREKVSPTEAKEVFADQPYKLELIEEITHDPEYEKEFLTLYRLDEFVDLCRGPHVDSSGQIGAFKLLSLAGAYWRGDENNKMLTRIYGTCFANQKELDNYLSQRAAAAERDHRRIGQELDLFSFHPEAAPGDIFWHDKGYFLMRQLMKFWRQEHKKRNYQEIRTPEIIKDQIWQQSGHLKSYRDKMYRVTLPGEEESNMAIKPMNCNGGILVYKNSPKSYRDLPLRVGELGVVHRYEASGELHGIIRPREFTQDDAHIYCTKEQIKQEIKAIIDLCFYFYETFNLELDHLELSTRPDNSIGSDEVWQEAEKVMKEIAEEGEIDYQINSGEGAFYGPKFDFHLQDSLGRTWQCSTIQLDFAQPENFDLTYTNQAGEQVRPVMIHRVVYGSLERFLGILIEDCGGAFPLWLSPAQVVIIPITDDEIPYAEKISQAIKEKQPDLRLEIDRQSQTASKKIHQAEKNKIPYMLIVGGREEENNTVNVRQRGEEVLGEMRVEEWLELVEKEENPLQ